MPCAVAPREGAWIEIRAIGGSAEQRDVAPREGAWIEMMVGFFAMLIEIVAPREGAWIEILYYQMEYFG